MKSVHHSLPTAPVDMEIHVKEVLPFHIEPERFVAEDGAGWMGFEFDEFRFRDPELDSWVHAVGKIMNDPVKLREAIQTYAKSSND